MALVIANPFKARLLKSKVPLLVKLTLRVFQNDFIPSDTSVTSDFTEADYPGYNPLKPLKWLLPFVRDDGKGEMDACPVRLTMTGGGPANLLYGYYFTDENGYFAFGYRFPTAPILFNASGATTVFQPRMLEDTMSA